MTNQADVETEVAETQAPEVATIEDTSEDAEPEQSGEEQSEHGDSSGDGEVDKLEKELKKLNNAVDKADRKKRQLKARMRELDGQLEKLKSAAKAPTKAPSPDDFETFSDFNEAKVEYKVKQSLEDAKREALLERIEAEKAAVAEDRASALSEVAAHTAKSVPDMASVLTPYLPMLDNVDPAISETILDLNNAPMALYLLAKEGKLERVLNSSAHLAAAYLLQADERGEKQLAALVNKPVKAKLPPEPMRGAKGAGAFRGENSLSGRELLKKYNL